MVSASVVGMPCGKTRYVFNPVTWTNWDETGVRPDVPVPAGARSARPTSVR